MPLRPTKGRKSGYWMGKEFHRKHRPCCAQDSGQLSSGHSSQSHLMMRGHVNNLIEPAGLGQ